MDAALAVSACLFTIFHYFVAVTNKVNLAKLQSTQDAASDLFLSICDVERIIWINVFKKEPSEFF